MAEQLKALICCSAPVAFMLLRRLLLLLQLQRLLLSYNTKEASVGHTTIIVTANRPDGGTGFSLLLTKLSQRLLPHSSVVRQYLKNTSLEPRQERLSAGVNLTVRKP